MSELSRLQRQQKAMIHCMNKACNDEPVKCPFCKSNYVETVRSDMRYEDGDHVCYVECKACYARGPTEDNVVSAISLWNKYVLNFKV